MSRPSLTPPLIPPITEHPLTQQFAIEGARVSPEQRAQEQVQATIVASRARRIAACEWVTPPIQDALADLAHDTAPGGMPLARLLSVIGRAIEADRAARDAAPDHGRLSLVPAISDDVA